MKCPGQDSQLLEAGRDFRNQVSEMRRRGGVLQRRLDAALRQVRPQVAESGLDFGCASYCQYAEQCIGELPPELIAQKEDLLKDRVAIEMKRYFKNDFKRIGHASRVARYADKIGKKEKGETLR